MQHAHLATLHGGVSLTMANVRDQHWIPRLRRLVKKVIKQCYGCKRFQAVAVAAPPPGLLPLERTEHSGVFEVVGVDFAGPIKYRKSPRVEGKAYLVLFACSLTRALYLEVLPNQETITFLGSLRAVCCKDQLRSCNIEKTDFPKLCQNKGLGELVLKLYVLGRLDIYLFFWNFFCILRYRRPKLTSKSSIFRKLPFKK